MRPNLADAMYSFGVTNLEPFFLFFHSEALNSEFLIVNLCNYLLYIETIWILMSSCHQCGYSLESDAETICPGCGIDLRHSNDQNNTNETGYNSSTESTRDTNNTPYFWYSNFR